MKKKARKLVLEGYYSLDGEMLLFSNSPIHGKTFRNVSFEVRKEHRKTCGINFDIDILEIDGEEPIECEFVGERKISSSTYVLGVCQEWG